MREDIEASIPASLQKELRIPEEVFTSGYAEVLVDTFGSKTCFEDGIHCFCEEPCNCFPAVAQEKVTYTPEFSKCVCCDRQGVTQWNIESPKRTAYDIWYCNLHYAERCQQLLPKVRKVETILDVMSKTLKCNPDEINTRVTKILKHIEELEKEKKTFEASTNG